MDARMQPSNFDPTALPGFSTNLLISHYRNNYGGAVKRLNAVRAQLSKLPYSRATALRLRAGGAKARYLRGGIEGWLAAARIQSPKGGVS